VLLKELQLTMRNWVIWYYTFGVATTKKFGRSHTHLLYFVKDKKNFKFNNREIRVPSARQTTYNDHRADDDGKVPGFAQQGCWLTCHDGERDMQNVASKDDAAANALLAAIKKKDVRKYLPASRDNPSDWKTGKSLDEIAKLKAAGGFVDLMQWRAHRSNPVGMADDGYVLEYRNSDDGKNMFGGNADKETHLPKFMWDEKKVGYKSITADQLRKGEHHLIREQNAVPFDPKAGWKEGDMLPKYFTSREDAKGSAADNNAVGSWKGGMWTVVLIRPLGLANGDDKALKVGGVYNVGFADGDDDWDHKDYFRLSSRPVALALQP